MTTNPGGPGADAFLSQGRLCAVITLAVASALSGCTITPAPARDPNEASTAHFVQQLCSKPEPDRSLTLLEINRRILPATLRVDCMD